MASIRIIKRRIKSAKNIGQITRAMQMVAASKMRRAQERAVKGKPYTEKISEMVTRLASDINPDIHPLLRHEGGTKILVVLITTNKGLCGALNTELLRSLRSLPIDEHIEFVTLGKKGASFVTKSQKSLVADFSQHEPFMQYSSAVTSFVTQGFLTLNYKKVYLFYNAFISALKQIPKQELLLPLNLASEGMVKNYTLRKDILIEPSRDLVLEAILPAYLEVKIRSAIIEAEAAEHSARMVAMKNATDNANEFMSALSLEYNKARQQAITSEIADIVTARTAVEVL